MKNDTLCLFSFIEEKRNEPQLSLLDWIHDNPCPALEAPKDILKDYYEKEIHSHVDTYLYFKKNPNGTSIMNHLVQNYPLPKKEGDV